MPWSVAASIAGAVVSNALSDGGGQQSSSGNGQSISTYAADTSANAAALGVNIANDQWQYYKSNFQPLEQALIAHASSAGSPEEFAKAAGEANADVTGAFNQAGKATESRLQSYGINPAAPAYQAAMGSTDLAKGASMVGAKSAARESVKNKAYAKALDVVGLGRNIPAQSAASAAQSSGMAANASRNSFLQNQANREAEGRAIAPIASAVGSAAKKWFTSPSDNYQDFNTRAADNGWGGNTFTGSMDSYGADGGHVNPGGFSKYASGGIVGEEPTAHKRMQLKTLLMKKGVSEAEAERQSRLSATTRYADGGPITPHMRRFAPTSIDRGKRYAQGGGVGSQGLEGMTDDASQMGELVGPGTDTSDSIPAVIDGETPAALSTGEVVVNAEAVNLSGAEILDAINEAGLRRRQRGGLEPTAMGGPMDSNDVSSNAGMPAYNRGGPVRYAHGLAGR